ncbi:Zn-dependent exopeptidase [Daedalea quercina L-15889]|uniref:Zn-dependent exopeptidase n=1 Tax=Daedalea quercina L-15889 TaxID=1314783 RepID=A0A165S329_9APHY|nr:Zn-dependent exopeptidase [Daedalea quercina L-15889]
MKGDVEKVALLPTTLEQEEEVRVDSPTILSPKLFWRWILKRVLVLYGFVALYVLAKRTYFKHELVPRREKPGMWALKAFGPHSRSRVHNAEVNTEELFLSVPSTESAFASSRKWATHPHLAGSSEDFEDAKDILSVFQDAFNIPKPPVAPVFPAGSPLSRAATLGINKLPGPVAWIDKYYPVMNTPVNHSLLVLSEDGETVWEADLEEDGDPADPDASKYRTAVPAWHGLSKDGEAEGELIYANYGRKEDYDAIVAAGGDLTGKIVLARYGAIFRGLKIQLAQEYGAAGVLIYSDTRDDGSVTTNNGFDTYPAGPARNPSSVQRGSVQFISAYPGDPTTPGKPAYPDAERTEGANIPKIPSLPISWSNAQKLLAELGDSLDEARILNGKSSVRKVKLVNHVDDRVIPIWNVMAAIPGHIRDETVLLGCHRDAWVTGAVDPVSGTVSLHELIRGFGALLESGWKPLRTIVIASWDAEEYGLVGSTEWAEDFPEWIQRNVVAYLNLDVSVVGSAWQAAGSPSLAHLIRAAAHDVPHPTAAGKSLWDSREDEGPFLGAGAVDAESLAVYEAAKRARRGPSDTGIGALGSGSDFTPFLQHLGIASMDQGFGGALGDAPYHYHSIYDSERWIELYGDPGFHRHVAVAKHMGLTAIRLIDSIILPLNTTQYAFELGLYLDEVEDVAASLHLDAAPNFSGLRSSIEGLQTATLALADELVAAEKEFKDALAALPEPGKKARCAHQHARPHLPKWLRKILHKIRKHWKHKRGDKGKAAFDRFVRAAKRVQAGNAKLRTFEQGFISEEGIAEREWYRHLVVAPGKFLGYGATTLPAVTEALTIEKNSTLAEIEAKRVSDLLESLSQTIAVSK